MAGWTVEKRRRVVREQLGHGGVTALAQQIGEDKRLVSAAIGGKADAYDVERVKRIEAAVAGKVGVSTSTMFGR